VYTEIVFGIHLQTHSSWISTFYVAFFRWWFDLHCAVGNFFAAVFFFPCLFFLCDIKILKYLINPFDWYLDEGISLEKGVPSLFVVIWILWLPFALILCIFHAKPSCHQHLF